MSSYIPAIRRFTDILNHRPALGIIADKQPPWLFFVEASVGAGLLGSNNENSYWGPRDSWICDIHIGLQHGHISGSDLESTSGLSNSLISFMILWSSRSWSAVSSKSMPKPFKQSVALGPRFCFAPFLSNLVEPSWRGLFESASSKHSSSFSVLFSSPSRLAPQASLDSDHSARIFWITLKRDWTRLSLQGGSH